MLRAYVWDVDDISLLIADLIGGAYDKLLRSHMGEESGIEVTGLVRYDDQQGGNGKYPVIPIEDVGTHFAKNAFDIMIIPKDLLKQQQMQLVSILRILGIDIDRIYVAESLSGMQAAGEITEEKVLSWLQPYVESPYLPYLEFHVADQCNLNCVACEHYSALVRKVLFSDCACSASSADRSSKKTTAPT